MNIVMTRIPVLFLVLSVFLISIPLAASAENPVTPQQEGWTIIEKEILYGDGPGEVGAYSRGEGDFGAPQSFAVDGKGTLFILDIVNRRVQTYASDLSFNRTIPLPRTGGDDIAVDDEGNIFIYYPGDLQIAQYDSNGLLTSTVDLDRKRWGREFGFLIYLFGNELFIERGGSSPDDYGFYLVGKIVNGKLVAPSEKEQDAVIRARVLQNGKALKFENARGAKITDAAGSEKSVRFSPPVGRKLLLGDDTQGNLYFMSASGKKIQTGWIMNIFRYNKSGSLINQIELNHDPAFLQNRRYLTDNHGNVYSMQAGKEQMLIIVAHPN